jgi:hypothetical protein
LLVHLWIVVFWHHHVLASLSKALFPSLLDSLDVLHLRLFHPAFTLPQSFSVNSVFGDLPSLFDKSVLFLWGSHPPLLSSFATREIPRGQSLKHWRPRISDN